MNCKNWFKELSLAAFSFIVLLSQPVGGMAQELPPGMVIGDDQGITVKDNGDYLVEVNDVLPGKKWHTTVSMVNMEKDVPYHLSMLISPPEVSGSLDLSKAIQMKLTYGGTIVYDGPVSGVNSILNLQRTPLDLGVFKAGDSRALEIDFSLSGTYTNKDFAKKNILDNVWTFYAVKTKESTPPTVEESGTVLLPTKPLGRFPSTGEAIRQGMVFLCLGLFVVLIVLLIWKAQHKSTDDIHNPH